MSDNTEALRRLIADDAYAISFQSMGQYRAALLKALAAPPAAEPDIADIVAGELQTSRAHAYELMRAAIAATQERPT
jgi:hypothetical protein